LIYVKKNSFEEDVAGIIVDRKLNEFSEQRVW